METHSRGEAGQLLRDLDADRVALSERLVAPPWLYPLFALVAAAYLATPALESGNLRRVVVACLAGAVILLAGSYRRTSGVRVKRAGLRGALLVGGLLVAVLLLLSVSFGLAASLSPWWVLAPSLVGFAVVLAGGRWFDRLYRDNLRRGH